MNDNEKTAYLMDIQNAIYALEAYCETENENEIYFQDKSTDIVTEYSVEDIIKKFNK